MAVGEILNPYSEFFTFTGTWDGNTMKLYQGTNILAELAVNNAGKIVNSDQPLSIGNDMIDPEIIIFREIFFTSLFTTKP